MNIFDKLNKVNFVPVVSFACLDASYMEKYLYKDKYTSFYSKNSMVSYDKLLVNPFHSESKWKEVKPHVRENTVIFSDSGGLQELTLGQKKQTPEEVVLWQENNAHIGFSFDSIPFIMPKKTEDSKVSRVGYLFDKKNFMSYAERSAQYLRRANNVRTNPDFKIYMIIQGNEYTDYIKWVNVLKSEKHEGYCVKCSSNSPMSMAESCLFAYFYLDKPVHFLGVELFSRSIICCYLSKYFKHSISFDGSSWAGGCRFRTYKLPFSCSNYVRLLSDDGIVGMDEAGKEDIIGINKFNFCFCPVCSSMDNVPELKNDLRFGMLLSLHNLLQSVNLLNFTEQILFNRHVLNSFVRNIFSESMASSIINAFDFIDYAVEVGYDLAHEKYKFILTRNDEVTVQTSFLDFVK